MARNKTPKKRSAQRTMSVADSPQPTSQIRTPSSSRAQSAQPAEATPVGADDEGVSQAREDDKPLSALPLRMQARTAGQKRRLPGTATGSATTSNESEQAIDSQQQGVRDDDASQSTPRRVKKPKWDKAKREARRQAAGATAATHDDSNAADEQKDVQGDFSDLFVIDTTPSAVPRQSALKDEDDVENDQPADEINQFTKEVYVVSSSEPEDDSEEESEDVNSQSEQGHSRPQSRDGTADIATGQEDIDDDSFEMPEELKGTIVDDSAAKVTGRYYKEADLTKSCALCGGKSALSICSRSWAHVARYRTEHEARHCPVMLVCAGCGSRGHFVKNCHLSNGRRAPMHQRCALCPSTLHMTVNCPTLWRIYDRKGARPSKRSIVLACANDGTTKDHFIDDCFLPRGHPIRLADPSAFNRAALGDAAARAPQPSLAPGGAAGKARRQAKVNADRQRMIDDDDADDDWFASRSRFGQSGHRRNNDRHSQSSRGSTPTHASSTRFADGRASSSGKGGRFARANAMKKLSGGGADESRHLRFSENLKDRFSDSPRERSRGSRDWDRPNDDDRRSRASRGGDERQSLDYGDRRRGDIYEDRDRSGGARRHGGNGGGTPSLASRIGPKPAPRYQGGYF
ncbi:hypothetical protein OIV83_000381 [Microbotryomycetes sp. JL201]|nr:hypothetical protein OIV83_000381 [Microbotryomycetes sp. JL201]